MIDLPQRRQKRLTDHRKGRREWLTYQREGNSYDSVYSLLTAMTKSTKSGTDHPLRSAFWIALGLSADILPFSLLISAPLSNKVGQGTQRNTCQKQSVALPLLKASLPRYRLARVRRRLNHRSGHGSQATLSQIIGSTATGTSSSIRSIFGSRALTF